MIALLLAALFATLVALPGRHREATCRLDDLVLWIKGR